MCLNAASLLTRLDARLLLGVVLLADGLCPLGRLQPLTDSSAGRLHCSQIALFLLALGQPCMHRLEFADLADELRKATNIGLVVGVFDQRLPGLYIHYQYPIKTVNRNDQPLACLRLSFSLS